MSSSDESSDPEPEFTLDISDDKHYAVKHSFRPNKIFPNFEEELGIPKYGSPTIHHSLPAYDLWRPFFPTYLSQDKFRNFHRPKLRHYNTGPQSLVTFKKPRFRPVKNLAVSINAFQQKLRNRVIKAIGQGWTREEIVSKYLLIRQAKDLTAKIGDVFLFEYCEQFPPVLSQIGMASNIVTYNKPREWSVKRASQQALSGSRPSASKLDTRANYKIGIDCTLQDEESNAPRSKTRQIYFNKLKTGTKLQVIENNLYRAPIFQQDANENDFLVIRTRNGLYIRLITNLYTVGQTMPLVAVPSPEEKSIIRFRTNLSNFYLHKLFRESYTDPPSIQFNQLHKLFSDYSSSILKRRLKTGGAVPMWLEKELLYLRGTSKYGLLPLIEQRKILSPEQYCLSMAMLAARERLRDLNYTESMILPDGDVEMETEILAAPWNTSKAIHNTMLGHSYLDLKSHLVDPTGSRREGFSCVAWSRSPTEQQLERDRRAGTAHNSVKNLSEIPSVNPLASKIKREKLERLAIHQREAQMIAEMQSETLGSHEQLSSSDGGDEDDDEDEDDPLNNSLDQELYKLDRLVIGGQSLKEFEFRSEERERRQMLKEFQQATTPNAVDVSFNDPYNVANFKNKVLRITRTYKSPDGLIQRTELVRDPKIIALYAQKRGGSNNCTQEISPAATQISHTSVDMSTPRKAYSDRRNSTLRPSELCRADGIVLTISKRVLNARAMRKLKRDSFMEVS